MQHEMITPVCTRSHYANVKLRL